MDHFDQFPLVKIEATQDTQKYLSVLIERDGRKKTVIFAKNSLRPQGYSHARVWDSVCITSPGNPTCLGGGQLMLDTAKKTISIWGKSSKFGQDPDRQHTKNLLQQAYPDHIIEVLE